MRNFLKGKKATPTDEAIETDYYKKLVELKNRQKFVRAFAGTTTLILFALVVYGVSILCIRIHKAEHVAITPSDLKVYVKEIPEKEYAVSITKTDTISGKKYDDVKIGSYKTTWPGEITEQYLQNNTKVNSKVYVLNIENKKDYPLSFITTGKNLKIVRYSLLGENGFSESDIENIKEQAAKYLTYKKYSLYHYNNSDEFYVSDKDIWGLVK